MKKLSLLLVFVLCLGCFAACGSSGGAGSPEDAVEALLEAAYEDFDAEDMLKLSPYANEAVVELLDLDSDEMDEWEEEYADQLEEGEEGMEDLEAMMEEAEISFDNIEEEELYEEGDDEFDEYLEEVLETEIIEGVDCGALEDYIEAFAKVAVDMEGEFMGQEISQTLSVVTVKIDGVWYVLNAEGLV